jgi:hypothetical protein
MTYALLWQIRQAVLAVAYTWGYVDSSTFLILAVQMQQQQLLLSVISVFYVYLRSNGGYLLRLVRKRATVPTSSAVP